MTVGCVTSYLVIRVIQVIDIRKNLSFRIATWQYSAVDFIYSREKNRFTCLHSEVLRYSSSPSTILRISRYN